MDLVMLMRGSKRLCAPIQAETQKPFMGINPNARFAMPESPDMDGSLWSCLPEDLVDRVLAWLPAASLLRLRTVCRKWSEIVSTKCFLEDCAQVNSRLVIFLCLVIKNGDHLRSQSHPFLGMHQNLA